MWVYLCLYSVLSVGLVLKDALRAYLEVRPFISPEKDIVLFFQYRLCRSLNIPLNIPLDVRHENGSAISEHCPPSSFLQEVYLWGTVLAIRPLCAATLFVYHGGRPHSA
jgi:hypothetical protein